MTISHMAILESSAHVFGISAEQLLSSGRRMVFTRARYACVYAFGILKPDLAWHHVAVLLKKDHSSVFHARQQAEERRKISSEFRDQCEEIISLAKSWPAWRVKPEPLPEPVPEVKLPPAVKSAPAKRNQVKQRRDGYFESDRAEEKKIRESEVKFIEALRREFPHLEKEIER